MKTKLIFFLHLLPVFLFVGCDSNGSSGPKNPISVLVVGDSQSSGGSYAGVPPWPSLLKAEEPEWNVINQAVRGETSAGGRARIGPALRRHQPDVIVIMYGANDAIQGRSEENFRQNISGMVAEAKAAGSRVVLVDIMPFFGSRAIFNGRVNRLNNHLNEIASREKVQLARVSREFRSAESGNLFPDGLHPNLDATRIIYVTIRERINSAASGL